MKLVNSLALSLALLVAPASEALAKDKGGKGHGRGHGHSVQKAERKAAKADRKVGHRHTGRAHVRHARSGRGPVVATQRSGLRGFDRNGDGVITRDEQPGYSYYGANARFGRWSDLDRDRDGVLYLREWPHGRQSFRDLDRNQDGVLNQWELRLSR